MDISHEKKLNLQSIDGNLPNLKEELFLLFGELGNTQLYNSKVGLYKRQIDLLENQLDYNIDILIKNFYMYFYLENLPVGYIQVGENREKTGIQLKLLITSNENSDNVDELMLLLNSMRIDETLELTKRKVPYLGLTIMKIFIEKYCTFLKISQLNITSVNSGVDNFYIKILDYFVSDNIIRSYVKNGNSYKIYLV